MKWTKLPLDLMNSRVGSSSNMLPNTTFFKTSKPFFYDYLIQCFRFYTSSPYLPPKERQIHTLLVVVVVGSKSPISRVVALRNNNFCDCPVRELMLTKIHQ